MFCLWVNVRSKKFVCCIITPTVIQWEFEQVTKKEIIPDLLPVYRAIHSLFQCSPYLYFFRIYEQWKSFIFTFGCFCFTLDFKFLRMWRDLFLLLLKQTLNCPGDSHGIYLSEPYMVSNELGGRRCWNGERSTRIQDNEIFTLWGWKTNPAFGNSLLLVPCFLQA